MSIQIRKIINDAYYTYNMSQMSLEVEDFLKFIYALKPKNILEIGSEFGGMFYCLTQVSDSNGIKISVDSPDFYGNRKDPKYIKFMDNVHKFGLNVHYVDGDSHSQTTYDRVKSILGDEELDFIFIDGDHSYNGVKKDFEMYKTLLKDGGYIGFHDINDTIFHRQMNCFVHDFWRELFSENKFEFNVHSFAMGIGVLQVFKHRKKLDIDVSFESPNKIYIFNKSEPNFNGYVSIRDQHTKIPIYFCKLNFTEPNQSWWIMPLINYDFLTDPYIGSLLVEFYDINKNFIDSKKLKIKDDFNKIEKIGTRIYSPFDCLYINYKQMFLDKIYDEFITDDIQTVIDIGANVGLFSNYISWKKNIKLIHAIEPVSKPFSELKKQFYYYNYVKCHKLGIHYNHGKSLIKVDDNQSILNTFINVNPEIDNVEEVDLCPLPNFMDNNNLTTIDLIKMDVEGLEYEILNSMNDSQILRCKNWLIEYHMNDDGKSEILQNRFSRLGFLVTNVPDNIPNNIGIQGFFFAKKV